jgi:hypothetical protein
VEVVRPLLHHSTLFLHVKQKNTKKMGHMSKNPFQNKHVTTRRINKCAKVGGTTGEKCGYGWGNMGEVASMEPSLWHDISNRIK